VVGPTSSPSVEIFEIRKLVQRFKRIKLAFAVNFVVCKSAKTKDLGTGLFRKNDCKSLSASQVTNFLLSTMVAWVGRGSECDGIATCWSLNGGAV